ncbi:MAG: hypothetical protein LBB27_03700 [Tannerellaceae bacterium]|nr:hypothetical protein [Tannerellaceae bacterium]
MDAQHTAEYNVSGDEAMVRGDYGDARMYYSEGLENCDLYSIGGLMWIWMSNEAMRPSMENLMERCETCLRNDMSGDSAVAALLEIGYSEPFGCFTAHGADNRDTIDQLPSVVETLPVDPLPLPLQGDGADDLPAVGLRTTGDATPPSPRPLLMAGYHASPDNLLGFGVGALWGKWGGYVRYKRSRTAFDAPQYDIGQFPDRSTAVRPLPEEQTLSITRDAPKRLNSYRMTAGVLYGATPWMLLSLGLGYGERAQLYSYVLTDKQTGERSSAWCTWPAYNFRGVAVEADVTLRYGRMFVGVGCAVTDFAWAELNFGVGILF